MVLNKKLVFVIITLVVILADQITKLLLTEKNIEITSFFSLSYAENSKIIFGLVGLGNWPIILISLVALGAIAYKFKKIPEKMYIPIALITAGIIGNLIDRVIHGYVIDFIRVGFWPTFNIADSALTIAVILLVIDYIKEKK
ncbi:MAG: signal peptidase II [bacterium]|nr:signal peptidase II [bacterium]